VCACACLCLSIHKNQKMETRVVLLCVGRGEGNFSNVLQTKTRVGQGDLIAVNVSFWLHLRKVVALDLIGAILCCSDKVRIFFLGLTAYDNNFY